MSGDLRVPNDESVDPRFSRFSFVPSRTTTSAWASQAAMEGKENADETSRIGSISSLSSHQLGDENPMEHPQPGIRPPKTSVSTEAGVQQQVHEVRDNPDLIPPENPQEESRIKSRKEGGQIAERRASSKNSSIISRIIKKPVAQDFHDDAGSLGGSLDRGDLKSKDPSPRTPTFAHVKHEPRSPRASKALNMPFLQKFRRSGGENKGPQPFRMENNLPHNKQDFSSFFDDPSTDGEDDKIDRSKASREKDKYFLGNAQQASFRRPVLVNHKSGTSSQIGLKNILHRGPAIQSGNTEDSTAEGGRSKLEPDHDPTKDSGQQGFGDPEPVSANRSITPSIKADDNSSVHRDLGLSHTQYSKPSSEHPKAATKAHEGNETNTEVRVPMDGLRSHPTEVKDKPTPKRQVTFPLSMEAIKGRNWEREDVISTPYPSGYTPRGEPAFDKDGSKETDLFAKLTVVVHGRGNGAPKVTTLHVPLTAHQIPIKGSERGEVALMRKDYDDATLARSLFAAYKEMRGSTVARCSARVVCGFKLLGFENRCQLATRRAKQQCLKRGNDEEAGGFAETRLLELYRKPKTGRGKWQWWTWIRTLPGIQTPEVGSGANAGNVALELVEGWSIKRILLALVLVAFCSFLATLLWIAAGSSRVALPSTQSMNPGTTSPAGSSLHSGSSGSGLVPFTPGYTPSGGTVSLPQTSYGSSSFAMPQNAPLASLGVPSINLGTGSVAPTMMQRDTPAVMSPFPSASDGIDVAAVAAETAGPQQPTMYLTAGAGSRVGAGVALGVLVLLFGCLIVGAWMAFSLMMG